MLRVGSGFDTHRLAPGNPLVIGGGVVPHGVGPVAHSDGDVLLHALTDALLGAAGLGDIGEWFPDNDPKYEGADSALLLKKVMRELADLGWKPINVDATVFAQRPKLSPYKEAIRQRVADLVGLPRDAVNIKAKTGEKVGPVGREEAIEAAVVVLIERTES